MVEQQEIKVEGHKKIMTEVLIRGWRPLFDGSKGTLFLLKEAMIDNNIGRSIDDTVWKVKTCGNNEVRGIVWKLKSGPRANADAEMDTVPKGRAHNG